MKLIPKNWREFQHYKDRNPPWIRLHRGLLDNKDFQRLPVESRALAPMLWLIASESVDGVIDASVDDLAFRLRRAEDEISVALRPLIDKGFFTVVQDASDALADREQPATPETEAERESEAEALPDSEAEAQFAGHPAGATAQSKGRKPATPKPPAPSVAVWDAYAAAYQSHYNVPPVRNAAVNSHLAQFVGRIGADESPAVAAFYVGHKNRLYVNAGHATNLLLRDAEKLRTEWATNRQVTSTQAQQADRTQTNFNAFAPLLARAEAEEANAQH